MAKGCHVSRRIDAPAERVWGLLTGASSAATDPSVRGGELYGLRFVLGGPPVRKRYLSRSMTRADLATMWSVSERDTDIRFDVEGIVRVAAAGAPAAEARA